ncbi:hypothetical protein E1B28_006127 [Marasmius oreades]|uniref:Uncharacterized protein n=1 Tax=Marasmius oreades TaxID=181124 RepID=A0A9P7S4P8_9AGAR|nr:uncharacterized protein E1B28_006127 [Marasmius oreades]KAG7095369.1 hypothetical protein E1B28_006127 [Marasmius oreades]
MPPRRVKGEPPKDGFDFMLSQASNSSASDDHAALEMAMAETFRGILLSRYSARRFIILSLNALASAEKRKKEHQQKILVAIKKHIMKEISGSVEEFNVAVQAIDELLEAFLISHATEEDNIRKIWCEIINEEEKLQAFIQKCRSDNVNARESGGALRGKGMAKIQTVCQGKDLHI